MRDLARQRVRNGSLGAVCLCLVALLLSPSGTASLSEAGPVHASHLGPTRIGPHEMGSASPGSTAMAIPGTHFSGPSPACLTQVDYWENVTCNVTGGPSARAFAGFAADSSCSCALLFGGRNANGPLADTWVFKNGAWENVSRPGPSYPPGRSSMGLTFDSKHDYFLLFGGRSSSGLLGDVWNYSGSSWSNLTPSAPPSPAPREGAVFTWDGAVDAAVLFGGTGMAGSLSDTWKFSSGGWSRVLPAASPSARSEASATYVPQLGGILLFGGIAGPNQSAPNDTWVFRSGNWTNLSPTFTGLSPPPRWGAALAYYPFFAEVLLLGGANVGNRTLPDEWTFDISGWTQVQAVGPSPRVGAMMASLIVGPFNDGDLLLFGGMVGAQGLAGDLWRYGAYYPILSTNPAVDVDQPLPIVVAVYGGFPPYSAVVSQGDGNRSVPTLASYQYYYTYEYSKAATYTLSVLLRDALGESVSQFTNVTVSPALTTSLAANVSATDVGFPVAFSASYQGGRAPYATDWNFSDGNSSYATFQVNRSFASPGNYIAKFLVLDGNFNLKNSTTQTVVHPWPRLIIPRNSPPVKVGLNAVYNASVVGGTPPFRLSWDFGDGSTGSGLNPAHSWGTPGDHTVHVQAQDSVGAIVRGAFLVVVAPSSATSSLSWVVPVGITGAATLAVIAWVVIRRKRRSPPPSRAAEAGPPVPETTGLSPKA